MLAQSYDFTQRLGDFSDQAKRKADDLNTGGQRAAPITPFLQDRAFDPETAQAVANALVMTCEALGLSNRDDAMTKLVAEKIRCVLMDRMSAFDIGTALNNVCFRG